ncbi:SIR2 family NAD-dependent protein deacylase [Rhizobium changzhiense]|uniref:SIR2 family protein n=1 Tax=Rhizobium changzhiense TaxID=2692317 RepID=A0ABR6AHQ9_9HYPH|nr:SIR2 family protein [Rhizobium changzhiense]MBA5806184.1 SIR2 family protein [Rhizobium changzhiense]
MNVSTKTKPADLPFSLTDAVRNGRVILFLGSGASKECKDEKGLTPPDGDQLRESIAKKFFGKPMANRSLMSVADMAIGSAGGSSIVFEHVNNVFQPFSTSEAHRALADFNWRTIATTNYDTFVEAAYSDTKRRKQTLIPFVKDDEPVEQRMMESINPLQYLKLHGCLNHRLDPDIPLVLAWDSYSAYSQNRTRLFDRLKDLARECPIVFVGYSLADSHIRDLINRIEPRSRPRWYIVDPAAEPEDITFWASKNIDVLPSKFGEFMQGLASAIPPLMRLLPKSHEAADFPLRDFYVGQSVESDQVRASFKKDLTLVHATMPHMEQTATRFYSGYDTGWGCILQRLDARRRMTDDLLFKILLENEAPSEPMFFCIRGPAGAGKTIILKKTAFEAATASKALVLWLQESGQLRPEVFLEIWDLTQRPIYLFVDQIALQVDKLIPFMKAMKARNVPVVLVGAEREADWATYCGSLTEVIVPQFLRMKGLTSAEVEGLLDLLKRHECLGDLAKRPRADQVAAFMKPEYADRQLLVALHVLTRGMPFEKIVLDEYDRVMPEHARQLYLDIASMNQFAVPVRAGTISRVCGIDFKEYEEQFFAPLTDMIATGVDNYSGDKTYKTRHPRVAELVFRQVCATDELKAKQFVRLIDGLDVGFMSDRRALEAICKGRTLSENFNGAEPVRAIYEAATSAAPRQSYLYQQWAIFESTHWQGDILKAEELAEAAFGDEPKNSTFIHTRAEVARKRALREESLVMKDQLRRQARQLLSKMQTTDRFATSSRCKLLVDETTEMSDSLVEGEDSTADRLFAEKLRETQDALLKAQQDFPEDAEMSEIESWLWTDLKDRTKALNALQRAWKKMPRGMGTAIRLAKLHAAAGNPEREHAVLEEALLRDPDDKDVHYAMAMHLLSRDPPDNEGAERHLINSFTLDDQNFEARHMLAQFLFAKGEVSRSDEMFQEIARRAPANFRRFAPKQDNFITARLPPYNGTIDTIRDGYFLVRSGAYPSPIFAHRTAFDEAVVDDIEIGAQMNIKVRFNRRGPVAVTATVRS